MFALEENQFRFCLDCAAPCLEESLLSLAKLRLEEVLRSFTEGIQQTSETGAGPGEMAPSVSTERYVGHLLVVFATSSRSSTETNFQPRVWLNTTWAIVTCRGLRPWVMWDIYE